MRIAGQLSILTVVKNYRDMTWVAVLLIALGWGLEAKEQLLTRPVVGILALPNQGDYNLTGSAFIDAGYVKWLEMAGARVVPLIITHPWSSLQYLVEHLDGVLFTGGDKDFFNANGTMTFYAETACAIFDLVKSLNDQGIYYPLWGTCLGFQLLHVCVSPSPETVQYMPDMPGHSALSVFTAAAPSSRLFHFPYSSVIQSLMTSDNVTFVSHNSGVPAQEYATNLQLREMYVSLSTMKTLHGVQYGGLIEGVKYPIYGSQFHPEKNMFEWWPGETIPHTLSAVAVSTYFANFFIEETRKNSNQFPSESDLQNYLIYNWAPYYWNQDPVQVYLFE